MHYDPHKPIAVFLGPSLERSQALQITEANYYPPARMGDIYRLVGSGVQIIVLIDGLFHSVASVWQRELLLALHHGIQVLGASSMGALRAAELHSFGMIGYGTIFSWYRDGIIDGDDEVALTHADASSNYRHMSEPLVNIRYNLDQAVRLQLISKGQYADLIAYAKHISYANRSYHILWKSPVVSAWPQQVRDRLISFIAEQAIDLKQQDAIDALSYCRSLHQEIAASPSITYSFPHDKTERYKKPEATDEFELVSLLHRGFWQPDGTLVDGESLLNAALEDEDLLPPLRSRVIKHYFLGLWSQHLQILCPEDYQANFVQMWWRNHGVSNLHAWLRTNGLSRRECHTELVKRARLRWLIEQNPHSLSIDFSPYERFLKTQTCLPTPYSYEDQGYDNQDTSQTDVDATRRRQAIEVCYLATWANEQGIACPEPEVERCIEQWKMRNDRSSVRQTASLTETSYRRVLTDWALVYWMIDQGLSYFGYPSAFAVALLRELQITGQAARLIASYAKDPTSCQTL